MRSSESTRYARTNTSAALTLGATLILSLVIPLLLESPNVSLLTSGSNWVLVAVPAALIASMLIRELAFRLQLRVTSKLSLALLYAIAVLAPSWLATSIFLNSIDSGQAYLDGYVSILAYASMLSGLAWIGLNTIGEAYAATRARGRLEQSLDAAQKLNSLLEAAENRRFLNYQSTIRTRVNGPLRQVLNLSEKYSSEKLAQQLELFQTKEMRPLSHRLHPVTVKLGLAPAIRSLGPVFNVHMSQNLVHSDIQGLLVHEHVRHQMFRWIQDLTPKSRSVEITVEAEKTHLVLTTVGVECVEELDPIAQVAGLVVECQPIRATMILRAPLFGQELKSVQVPMEPETRKSGLGKKGTLALLTVPPYMQLSLVLLIGILTSPISFKVLRVSPDAVESPFILVAILGVVIPLLLAVPLHLFVKRGSAYPKPWKIVTIWVCLGVLSGLANNLIVYLVAPEKFLLLGGTIRMFGSLVKFTGSGLLFAATKGYVDQQDRDMRLLESASATSNRKRVRLLESADETDRYLAEALHRTIQGRLSAIALLFRLDRREEGLKELQVLCEETVPGIEQRLIEALLPHKNPELPIPAASTGLRVEDNSLWSELFEKNHEIASHLKRVVHECEVNAQRHGGATHMWVTAGEVNGFWEVRCADNGRGPSRWARPGLGANLFDELCAHYSGEWSLDRIEQQTVFELHIRLIA